ncbi:hypothetical protein ACLBVK_23590, partial [Pseudomonas aeruginosa]
MSGSLLVPASLASRIRLLLVMTRREVELRYRDAMLGRIWIIAVFRRSGAMRGSGSPV